MSEKQVTYTTAKKTRRAIRIWFEGQKLALCGFKPGAKYRIDETGNKSLTLTLDPDGDRKVSEAKRGSKARPIIDLHSKQIEGIFDEGDRVCVTFTEGTILVNQHHEEKNQAVREASFRSNLRQGFLTEASMFTGGGVSTEAIHSGIANSGINSKLIWIAEAEWRYVQSAGDNCLAIDDDTTFLVGHVEEIEPKYYQPCNVLSFSMPCAGVAKCGTVKHKKTAEAHSGTALFGVVHAVRSSNPAVIISENVVEAQNSSIYILLKSELERLGYRIHEIIMDNSHTDSIENRKRYWLVAISRGLPFEELAIEEAIRSGRTVRDILENDIPESMWADNQYLKDKQVKDKAAGKGFAKRQLLNGDETKVGTIGRFYQKRRSTEPFITRPDGKERLFTPVEHARVKSVPEHLIENQSNKTAHEILGQSVDYRQPLVLTESIVSTLKTNLAC